VGSTHHVLGPFGSDSDLRRHGEKIASRGGKNRAVVAVAWKLCVLLHRLWVGGGVYEPLYNTRRSQVQREEDAA
jgi:transposase